MENSKEMTQEELRKATLFLTTERAAILYNALMHYIAEVPVCVLSGEVNVLLRALQDAKATEDMPF